MIIVVAHSNKRRETGYGKCNAKNEKSIGGLIKIDENGSGAHLNQLVRQSVEDTINSLLDAEAEAIGNAACCLHNPDRLEKVGVGGRGKLLFS